MIAFKPVPFKMGQPLPSAPVPPPSPDPLFTGYTGIPGAVETLLVLGATGAAAWLGLTTALDKKESKVRQTVGWVSGIGAALAGLLYLGGKSGANQMVGLPAVRVTPV